MKVPRLFLIPTLLFVVIVDVFITNIFLIEADEIQAEDAIVISRTARVEGTIEGDLTVMAGSVFVEGTVTGNVLVASHGKVDIAGVVGGSVRGAARDLRITGEVGNDVAVTALTTTMSGTVGRDLLLIGGRLTMDGTVGRDVLGRAFWIDIDGRVGRDVDVAVRSLTVGANAAVDGDLLYRADSPATIDDGAEVAGIVRQLTTRASFAVRVVLWGATILSFLAFLVSGLVILWLFRSTGPRAAAAIVRRPLRTFLVGLVAFVAIPAIAIALMFTLVGLPVGLALIILVLLGLVFGPVPAVTALGDRLLLGRAGLFAAFALGAILWRGIIWLVPVVGAVIYVVSVVWGGGGWLLAIWDARKAAPAAPLFPPRRPPDDGPAEVEVPDDWEPPLSPTSPPVFEDAAPAPEIEVEPRPPEPESKDEWGLPEPG